MNILVTGAAGFIGFHVARRLLERGHHVVGLDNMNSYYDVRLKQDRLAQLEDFEAFRFCRADIADREGVEEIFAGHPFQRVIHLAAQAGVRYSLTNPHVYVESNVKGFLHVLEGCRSAHVPHLLYASSSSVYGLNSTLPFSVRHSLDHPISLYAATKRANELIAHVYSHLYDLPSTGLRFFTVYGPWGRPDMAPFIFADSILRGRPLKVFNHGKMERDFTYIDDVVEGVVRVMDHIPERSPAPLREIPDPSASEGPYRLYNIGNQTPVALLDFIAAIEDALGIKAQLEYLPMQPGDLPATFAEVEDLCQDVGFRPRTPLATGIGHFVKWYLEYYGHLIQDVQELAV